jgi:hypothetical protein
MVGDVISETLAEELVGAARTATGDELRSATAFDRDGHEQLSLRSDLGSAADVETFVENERLGFASRHADGDTELGDYPFTVRSFEFGFPTRVIVGEEGVFVTTDEMEVDRIGEVAAGLRGLLRGG